MLRRILFIPILLFVHNEINCQNLYVSNYTQKEYGSSDYITSPQNWNIEQDSLGRMYVANSSGILIFDGLTWKMIPGTENFNLYSLAKANNSIIYAGGREELGYFRSDSLGRIVFKSLVPLLKEIKIDPGTIKEVFAHGDSVYFKNENGVILYHNHSLEFYPISSKHHGIVELHKTVMVQDDLGNLLALQQQQFDTIYSFGSALSSGIVSLTNSFPDQLLLFTSESGVFKIEEGELEIWNPEMEKFFSSLAIKKVIKYPELELFGLASSDHGIVFVDYDGNIVSTVGTDQGLTSNTCYSLFRDKNHELWACLDIGIARIEYPPALSYFDYTNGLNGILSSAVEYDDQLFVGTTNGLYYLDSGNKFNRKSISEEVWDLKVIDNTLWIAASSGLYHFTNKKLQLIKDIEARCIVPSPQKNRYWIGLGEGLASVIFENGKWKWAGKLEGIDHEVRTIAAENDSIFWGSFEKISRIEFTSDLSDLKQIQVMNEDHGFDDAFYITESYNLRNDVVFGTAVGLYSYDNTLQQFVQNSSFGQRFGKQKHEAYALTEDSDSNIWLTSNRTIGRIVFENGLTQKWDTLAFARLKTTDVWRIVPINNKKIIYFCTTDGLFKFDQNVNKKYDISYHTLINKIELNRDSVVSYLETGRPDFQANTWIPFKYNDLRFTYSATTYNYDEKILFSYKLDGFDDHWSGWETESVKEYTNLSHGAYKFQVRAKNLYGVEANPSYYYFTIEPPWYRTYWAYGISLVFLVSGVILIDRVQRKRLFKKQQLQIKKQQQKLERERQISNKLRKVDRLKDEFLANTSHELRTPLNGIIGISESLYEESQNIDEEEMKSNLAMVIASGKRLASLVDSILDYSKLKTENLEIRKRPVDLNSIVKVVLTMSRPLISRESLRLINNVPENIPLVEADENRLQQILYNLVGNAIKFSEKGKISVGATKKDDYIEIFVIDEGAGIPEDKLDKIFDSYEQVNVEINREYIGTGLGLTITKKLVELHNGKIRVESTVGEGSKFIFTIPVSLRNDPSWTKTEVIDVEEGNLTTKIREVQNTIFNILIVDDEPINRQVLINHLKNEPYHLEVASGGTEALELIAQNKFDLVLLDVMMPVMSGFEVCMKIREKFMLSELPVIFITAKGQIIDLVEGLKYGGNDYITKPFSKQEFLARIRTHLNLIKINDSYSRFIPYEFLRSLGRESIMEVNLGDQVEKDVTILFSDIRDYTTLSERMTPRENFDFLNSFLNKMGPVIRENDGFVMQYLGDGLMSIFLHNPVDAVNASIEMVGQIEAYNLTRTDKLRKPISVGFGIHSGKLMMGVIGDEKRMDVNVVSDSVNTASRMEGLTKYYGASIIMSEDTLNGIKEKNDLHYRFLGLVKVKGKTKPLKIYEVLDGVTSVSNKLKVDTREVFETGLQYYFSKDFINAAAQFKHVSTENNSDLSAQMYLKLSAKYMVENVPENWTGVETMILK